MAASVSTYILSQADSEAAGSLEKLLNGRSREPASEASMVEGIYLALRDCYEESGNVWCHGMAVSGLKTRKVTHFHYTAWPDHGVPDYATSILYFHKMVVKDHKAQRGPLLVHCR